MKLGTFTSVAFAMTLAESGVHAQSPAPKVLKKAEIEAVVGLKC